MKANRAWIFWLLVVIAITVLPKVNQLLAVSREDYDRPPESAFVTRWSDLVKRPYIAVAQTKGGSSGRLIGVVGAWTLGNSPQASCESSTLRLDSTFCVRFRDLDGWILRLLSDRAITGAEALSKDDLKRDPEMLCKYADRLLQKENGRDSIKLEENEKTLLQQKLNRLVRIFQSKLYPIINGIPYPEFTTSNPGQSGLYWRQDPKNPDVMESDKDCSYDLEFAMRRDLAENDKQDVLVRLQKQIGLLNKVNLTLGIEAEGVKEPLMALSLVRPDGPASSQQPRIVFVPWFKMVWAALLVGVMTAFLIWMGRNTNMLRSHRLRRRPTGALQYSLSHCQLAFWFAVIFVTFVYLWMVLDEIPKFSETAFFLTGISLVTAIGASFTTGKHDLAVLERYNREMALREGLDETRLERVVSRLSARATNQWKIAMWRNRGEHGEEDLDAIYQNHVEMQRQLRFLKLRDQWVRRWLVDLLSEHGDVTLPRVQMFVWTVVLGFFFLWHAFTKLEMPDFSAPILALMRLSAGGFVGFRVQEVERAAQSLSQGNSAAPTRAKPAAKPAS